MKNPQNIPEEANFGHRLVSQMLRNGKRLHNRSVTARWSCIYGLPGEG